MIDAVAIQRILPHRYPFLLVDRVVELELEKRLVAFKNVSGNEPFFNGHFPGHPVMPGVLILEALAQSCAILAYKTDGVSAAQKLTYLMGIDKARFRKPVVPGDRLMLSVEVLKRKSSVWKQRGVATVEGVKVAEAEFLATVVDKDAPMSQEKSDAHE